MKNAFYLLAVAAFMMAACTKSDGPGKPDEKPAAPAPTADFSYSADGLKVTFTDKSSNATSYKWDFGDGNTAKTASATHEYAASGTYTVKLTVANSDGVIASKEESLTLAGHAKSYFTYVAQTDRAGRFGLTVLPLTLMQRPPRTPLPLPGTSVTARRLPTSRCPTYIRLMALIL